MRPRLSKENSLSQGHTAAIRKARFHSYSYSSTPETQTMRNSTCPSAWDFLEIQNLRPHPDLLNPNLLTRRSLPRWLSSTLKSWSVTINHFLPVKELISSNMWSRLIPRSRKVSVITLLLQCRAGLSSMLLDSLTIAASLQHAPWLWH